MSKHRPEWAADAFSRWHKTHCDHTDPTSCGYEGRVWFQHGLAWCRANDSNTKTLMFYDDGKMEIREWIK